jgi:hypothetical protein
MRPLQALVWWNYIIYLKGRRTLQLKKANLSVQNVQLDVLMSSLLSLNQRVSMEATSDSRFAGEARPSTANQHALCVCVESVAGQQGSVWSVAGQQGRLWSVAGRKASVWRRRRTARSSVWRRRRTARGCVSVAGRKGVCVRRRVAQWSNPQASASSSRPRYRTPLLTSGRCDIRGMSLHIAAFGARVPTGTWRASF